MDIEIDSRISAGWGGILREQGKLNLLRGALKTQTYATQIRGRARGVLVRGNVEAHH